MVSRPTCHFDKKAHVDGTTYHSLETLLNLFLVCLGDEAVGLLTLAINFHVFDITGEKMASFTALYVGRQLVSDNWCQIAFCNM